MLEFDLNREPVTPKDAATLILLRASPKGIDVFCVERNRKLKFMGGAIVFPGGKLDDAHDRDPAWNEHADAPDDRGLGFAPDSATLRALAIAACRESLEEAAILPVRNGALSESDLLELRAALTTNPRAMLEALHRKSLMLDIGALHPFARWITPTAETRRFDARFFVAIAPEGQPGAHDESETMASFWAAPTEVLERFDKGEVQLAPPTHRTLEILAATRTPEGAIAAAKSASLEPICPRLVQQEDTLALVLPGDREHEVKEPRVAGASRYVLRGDRWRAENAP
jgi:8-oxo-dGTP pyrophosphatase MutT (NUDIX family)